jgi:hypothetical protein
MAFQEVEVAYGNYIGWGQKAGQHVTGWVSDFSETDGTDFDGNQCPVVEVVLQLKAASFNKEGERTNYEPGDTVHITAGSKNLAKAVRKAALDFGPLRGKLIRIELTGLVAVDKGKAKQYKVSVDPTNVKKFGSGGGSGGEGKADTGGFDSDDDADDDEPPF